MTEAWPSGEVTPGFLPPDVLVCEGHVEYENSRSSANTRYQRKTIGEACGMMKRFKTTFVKTGYLCPKTQYKES